MKFVVIITLIHLVNSQDLTIFNYWQKKYQKSYKDTASISFHARAFEANAKLIARINGKENRFKLELNNFADLPYEIFSMQYLRTIVPDNNNRETKVTFFNSQATGRALPKGFIGKYTISTAPAMVDYRNISFEVRNQKQCGSCWAFAAIEVLESRKRILDPSFDTPLSVQYLIDCDRTNYGCNGGWPNKALNWIISAGENSVPSAATYPYYNFKMRCRKVPRIPMNITATVQNATAGDEDMMKVIVANVGPVAAVISVTPSFLFYKSGIFYDTTCNSDCTSVNHAVVIVGYGRNEKTNEDYWIVKNSFGPSWGQGGYIYMSRNQGNQCNIACWAMYVL